MSGIFAEATDKTVDANAAPVTESPDEETQFTIALRRILNQDCPVDPQSPVAPFNSAF